MALREAQRTVSQPFAQRLAFQQLRNDIGRAVIFADIEDRKNVGMVQRGGRAGFLREALQAFGIR